MHHVFCIYLALSLSIVSKNMKIYESKENEDSRIIVDKGKDLLLVLNEPLILAGDVKFEITAKALKKGKFATFWINTTFIPDDGILGLTKNEIDKVCKDTSHKEVSDKFWIELRYFNHIEKSVLPNVNTSASLAKNIRPVSVLGLSSPLQSTENIIEPIRRQSTGDIKPEVSKSKPSLEMRIASKPIAEVDEVLKRSGSLPNFQSNSDQPLPLEETDDETDEE